MTMASPYRSRLQGGRPKSKAPKDMTEWAQLARAAIQAAQIAKDKREHSIRLAVQKGQVEMLLRKWGIICAADIIREFPPPKT